jgi:type II secretory pathway pseudopilin PulG
MLMRMRNMRGDTIVEVMIVLAILGAAIGTSYAIATRSLNGARQAEEHSEALGLVQGQIESLRAVAPLAKTNSGSATRDIFAQTSTFCIVDANSSDPIVASSNPSCTKGFYKLSVSYDSARNVFTVSAAWDSIGTSTKDNVSMVYRVHKEV